MPEELIDRVKRDFGYHPATPETIPLHEATRDRFLQLAEWVVAVIPAGRDQVPLPHGA